jgi:hypothetical protein
MTGDGGDLGHAAAGLGQPHHGGTAEIAILQIGRQPGLVGDLSKQMAEVVDCIRPPRVAKRRIRNAAGGLCRSLDHAPETGAQPDATTG